MCGIAGIIHSRNNLVEDIRNMNEALYRRGPDAGSYWMDEEGRVVFGHRRLSVVDLSSNGAQPMVWGNGCFAITYNGEIYNYKELERQLCADGCPLELRGTSDTEVVLEAFGFYGIDKTLRFVKGMCRMPITHIRTDT